MKEPSMADDRIRPSWNVYFLNIAREVAQRSTCERAQVGAVIVRDKRILTTGYNGSPRGLPHCTEVGCLMDNGHCVRTLHAEQNAIIQAALHGVITEGATIYVTHQPCFNCAKTIINAGISEIVYDREYQDDRSLEFLTQAGVKLIAINGSK
jgi:dCMP deaminase